MARRFADSNKKKIKLPSLSLSGLPKLLGNGKRAKIKKEYDRVFSIRDMGLLLAATILLILGLILPLPSWGGLALLAAAAFAALLPALLHVIQRIFQKRLPEEDLFILIAVIAAFILREEIGAAFAAVLYRLAQILEAYALARGDAAFDELRDRLPEKATLEVGDSTLDSVPEAIEPGQVIRVAPGAVIPLDGVLLSGLTTVDQSALTGNREPVTKSAGDEVFSGSVNGVGEIRIRVSRSFGDSAAASLLREIENSSKYETTQERICNRIATWCGPILAGLALVLTVGLSLITGDWARWIRCGILFLLLSSPSALAISIPIACLGAEINGVRRGILSKGHDCFEILAQTKTMVFGKTGTITEGRFAIAGVYPVESISQEDLLAVAAAAEGTSRHPIASVLKLGAGWTPEMAEGVMEVDEIPGRGVSAFIEGKHVYVGNASLMEDHGIPFTVPSRSGAAIHVAVAGRYWGHILVSDKTREGAFDALETLRSLGVDQLVMLTGDVLSASRPLASSLGFDLLRTELSTQKKVSAIDYLISGKGNRTSVGFVGDGINDAPMLERADVGIAIDALHAWREAEAADILLLDNEISLLPAAMKLSQGLRRVLWENIGILAGVKLLLLILALCSSLPIVLAGVISTAASALALLNGLRVFGLK